jgi:aromatic ring-opening dioxygenase LigB subunit
MTDKPSDKDLIDTAIVLTDYCIGLKARVKEHQARKELDQANDLLKELHSLLRVNQMLLDQAKAWQLSVAVAP